jgi:tripartite ATP-independent transporter DctP family solute receptor
MKKVLTVVLSLLLVVVLLTGCSQGNNAANNQQQEDETKKVEPMILKLSHVGGPEHAYQKGAELFRDKVKERTNGAIDIDIFPSGQLGSQKEVTEGVQLGTIDIMIAPDDGLITLVPEFGALGMPFLFEDTDHVYETLNGPVGDLLAEKLKSKGLVIVSWMENGFRHITNNERPIYEPSDLKGLKMRTSSTRPNMAAFNAYGASATNIGIGELYNALQLGVVDGQENPYTNIIDRKFYEVQKYLSVSGHVHTSEPMIFSKVTWDKLTPEQQEIVLEVGKEVSKWAFDYSKENLEKELEYLKTVMEVNEVNREAFVEASKPVYDEFYDDFKEILDMIQ